MTKKQLTQAQLRAEKALKLLQEKKEKCVADQNAMEDEFLSTELTTNRKYQKLIELDFELADKIEDAQKNLRNVKAKIRRLEKINDKTNTDIIASFVKEQKNPIVRAKVEVYGGIAEVTRGDVEIVDMDNLKVEGYSSEERDKELKSALSEHQNVVLVSGGCTYVEKGDVEIVDNDNKPIQNLDSLDSSDCIGTFLKKHGENNLTAKLQ